MPSLLVHPTTKRTGWTFAYVTERGDGTPVVHRSEREYDSEHTVLRVVAKVYDWVTPTVLSEPYAVERKEMSEEDKEKLRENLRRARAARSQMAAQKRLEKPQKPAKPPRRVKPTPTIESAYYDTPCRRCGAQIPRTGKRGRPPVKCQGCR